MKNVIITNTLATTIFDSLACVFLSQKEIDLKSFTPEDYEKVKEFARENFLELMENLEKKLGAEILIEDEEE